MNFQYEKAIIRGVQTEQDLRASELSYRRLFESAKDGILILNVDTGRINDVNPFLARILGFSHDEMVGKTVGELSPFRDIEENQVMLERLQKDGYVRYEDLPLETRDGRHLDVEFVSNVYQAGDKKVIQCNIRDITERKRAERALHQSEAEFRTLAEAMPQIVWVTNADGRHVYFNQRWMDYTGLSLEESLGDGWSHPFHPEDRQRAWDAWQKAIAGAGDYALECRLRRADGVYRWWWILGVPFKADNGSIHKWFGTCTDITERKHAENEIRHFNAELEQRVTERTAQLQAANQELDAFSYTVSHDLRAPLRHIMAFVELLQKDAGPLLSAKSLQHLTTITLAAKRMGKLIDDLLAFSRVGQSKMQKQAVNLDQLIREACGDFQSDTKERDIVWKIHPLPSVQADRALLRMVLVNLLSNAVKFTSARREAIIEIGCFPGDDQENVIFIRDNGAGFDPKYTEKLFGVFQRLHSHDEFEGTGIGLANVQHIIQRHGGRTWAEGAVGGGATFYFSLPKENESGNGR